MALPGNRTRQKLIEIASANVTGALNFDFLLTLTEVDFDEQDLTLGGTYALDAAPLAASKDALGLYQYALDVIRLELDDDYTLSRVEIVVRIPAEEINTLDNATVWLWWLSSVDTQPAATEDFGRYDVYNAITDSTGGSIPLVTRCATSFDELPTGTAPQYPDHSGNAQHVTASDTTGLSRIDLVPGRGLAGANNGNLVTAGAFAPGTGDWAIVELSRNPAGASPYLFFSSDYWWIITNDTQSRFSFQNGKSYNIATSASGVRVLSMTRDGDVGIMMSDELSATVTGISATSFSTGGGCSLRRPGSSNTAQLSLAYLFYCAPNIHWYTMLSRTINHSLGTIISHASNEVGVTGSWTTINFSGLNPGCEVRVVETPHNAIWVLDYTDALSASIGVDYVDFDIATSTTTDRHYIWWTTDPSLSGATGHQVTRTGSETDEQLAALACAVIDGLSDVSATVDGAVITVTNARNGLTAKPVYHGQQGAVSVTQIGGTSTDYAVDGVEETTTTGLILDILVDQPRRLFVSVLNAQINGWENLQFEIVLSNAGLLLPMDAMQQKERWFR